MPTPKSPLHLLNNNKKFEEEKIPISSTKAFPMASKLSLMLALALALALCVQGTLGGVTCEELDQDTCAFAVSSLGKRCVLEKHIKRSGEEAYTCRASDIEADKLKDVIETDHCVKACGVDRKTLGISSDSLLESRFTQKLCSPNCYGACPNIVDLYFNLAAGEGVFLPKLCEAQGANARRGMAELKSSGFVAAPAPLHSTRLGVAPVVSPSAEAPAPIHSARLGVAPVVSPSAEAPAPIYY